MSDGPEFASIVLGSVIFCSGFLFFLKKFVDLYHEKRTLALHGIAAEAYSGDDNDDNDDRHLIDVENAEENLS